MPVGDRANFSKRSTKGPGPTTQATLDQIFDTGDDLWQRVIESVRGPLLGLTLLGIKQFPPIRGLIEAFKQGCAEGRGGEAEEWPSAQITMT